MEPEVAVEREVPGQEAEVPGVSDDDKHEPEPQTEVPVDSEALPSEAEEPAVDDRHEAVPEA